MGRMDRTMQAVAVMKDYGWTYEQYLDTPAFILSVIMEKMRIDQKKDKIAANRSNRGK
jgi:hypothetical protein